jgi:ribosomal small subunit protein bTHX
MLVLWRSADRAGPVRAPDIDFSPKVQTLSLRGGTFMGKGDKRTKRGKLFSRSFGKRRLRKKKKGTPIKS